LCGRRQEGPQLMRIFVRRHAGKISASPHSSGSEMSIDLIHTWPLLLVALVIVVPSLVLALRLGPNLPKAVPWVLGAAAVLLHLVITLALEPEWSQAIFGWRLATSLMFAGVPVVLASQRAARLQSRGTSRSAAFARGMLLGLGVGWVLLPILLFVAGIGTMLATG
jgi:hypothetical protein